MNHNIHENKFPEVERYEMCEAPQYEFDLSRRGFVQILGAGLLISIAGSTSAVERSSFDEQQRNISIRERLHIGTDGVVTVMTGKVEIGQGSRTEITQAAAEELRLPVEKIRLIMADTDLVPDDGSTSGSRTTPRTIPVIRNACAAAREVLIDMAAARWKADSSSLIANNGTVINKISQQVISYGELANMSDMTEIFNNANVNEVSVTPVEEWRIMGDSVPKTNATEIVSGSHRYPSDIEHPDMLYGRVLHPPAFGATLVSVDLRPTEAMQGVTTVRDGSFVGVTAPTTHLADQAINELARTARWELKPHPSSKDLFNYLKKHASSGNGGYRRSRKQTTGSVQKGLSDAAEVYRQSYRIAYIQHVPMEPRAAVAVWNGSRVTVWTGTQQLNRVREEVAEAFRISLHNVRIIVPDTGGAFGGKHTGETAVQAARLARAAQKPVSVQWTRQEEFTWAYFRPAGLIEIRSGLDSAGKITAWEFINYNSGTAAIETPYAVPNTAIEFKYCDSPLREGSYRTLAATANNFARESFMDELTVASGADPLEFRLGHLENDRLRAVLNAVTERFEWEKQKKERSPNRGIGLACGTEKGSYTAACVEIEVDRSSGSINVLEVCQAFECGAIINPANLRSQIEGSIIMGLGGALWEEIHFENGELLNASLRQYRVPRFKDVPEIETILVDRPDLPSVGGGETPIIVIAPAIANAVFDATGIRIRSMPIKSDVLKQG